MARAYPWQTAFMVGALLLAGIMDAIGLSMLLPLLSIAVGKQKDPEEIPVAPDSEQISKLEELVSDAFAAFGITPTIGIVLMVIIAAVFLKSALMLLAKKPGRFHHCPGRHEPAARTAAGLAGYSLGVLSQSAGWRSHQCHGD